MTMMTCPKCGFEQPKDQFCAKCGVNVESYKPQIALASGLSSLMKPVVFVLVIIAILFFLFKNVVQKSMTTTPELEVEQSTQLGVGAGSLNTGKTRQAAQPQATQRASRATQPTNEQASTAPKAVAEAPSEKFNLVSATFTVAEHAPLDAFSENSTEKTWGLVAQTSAINSFVTEDVNLKLGNNTFDFVDDLIRYDITLNIQEITNKSVKIRLNMRRLLRASTTAGNQGNSASIDTEVPLDQSLIIIDPLPRNAVIDRPNSILSTLYKSQLFLSRASELVQIIKFNNPSNSAQE